MATRTVSKAKTATAKVATDNAAPPEQQNYLMPAGVDALLGDARQMFVDIVSGLPAKLRVDYMREANYFKAIVLRGASAEYLRKCHPKSLITQFNNIASLGLTLNPIKKHATVIARWNKDEKIFEADALVMYQGLMFLATQAGVRDIVVEVVYAADKFVFKRTSSGDVYEHEINLVTPRGVEGNEFRGVYVAAKMPGSDFPKVEWIPCDDIYKMRQQSDSYLDDKGKPRENSPWVKWFDEQAKKGGLKRASKRWEEQVETNENWNVFKQAVETDNRAEGGGRTFDNSGSGKEETEEYETVSLEQAVEIDKALKAEDMKVTLILDAYEVEAIKDLPADKNEEILARIKKFGEGKREKLKKTGKVADAKPATEAKK